MDLDQTTKLAHKLNMKVVLLIAMISVCGSTLFAQAGESGAYLLMAENNLALTIPGPALTYAPQGSGIDASRNEMGDPNIPMLLPPTIIDLSASDLSVLSPSLIPDIQAVPEPSSISLGCSTFGVLIVWRAAKRNRSPKKHLNS